jgi:hypothetical protein
MGEAGPPGDRVGEVTITAAFSLLDDDMEVDDEDGLRFFGGAMVELTTLAKSDKEWSPFFLPLSVDSSCDLSIAFRAVVDVVVVVVLLVPPPTTTSSSSSSSSLETAGVAGISSDALVSGLVNVVALVVVVLALLGDDDPWSVVVVGSSSFISASTVRVVLVVISASSSCSASSFSSSCSSSFSSSFSSSSSSWGDDEAIMRFELPTTTLA